MKIDETKEQVFQSILNSSGFNTNRKKLSIVEATVDLLAEVGIENVTFESVGKKLNTTKANIRYHFQDKEELIFVAVKFIVLTAQAVTRSLMESAKTKEQQVNAVILGAFTHLRKYPNQMRAFMMLFYYAAISEKYNQLYREARITGRIRLSIILADLPRKKSVKNINLDFEQLAEQIQNIITGQLFAMVLLKHPWNTSLLQTQKMIKAIIENEGILWNFDGY